MEKPRSRVFLSLWPVGCTLLGLTASGALSTSLASDVHFGTAVSDRCLEDPEAPVELAEPAPEANSAQGDQEELKRQEVVQTFCLRGAFDANSSYLRPESHEELDWIAEQIRHRRPDQVVVIAGHTDSVGSENYNLWLSDRRAMRVGEALVARGACPASVFRIQACGESQPEADNATEAGREENRRVTVTLWPASPAVRAEQPVVRKEGKGAAETETEVSRTFAETAETAR